MSDEVLNGNAQSQIRSVIERAERLEREKAEITEQLKEVYAEAKANGLDAKVLRKIVRMRKQDSAKRQEEEAITDLYLSALGELPLFEGRAAETATLERPDGSAIATITLVTADGKSVSATPDVMQAALSSMKSDDDLYAEAVALVRRDDNPSTSYVQRRLQLGYNRAASLIERMEREGVVSPADIAGKRRIISAAA